MEFVENHIFGIGKYHIAMQSSLGETSPYPKIVEPLPARVLQLEMGSEWIDAERDAEQCS